MLMLRASLAFRIGMIVVISLCLLWLSVIALFFSGRMRTEAGARPPPAQVAAIVRLVENAPPSDRLALLAALQSDTLSPRIEPGLVLDTGRIPAALVGDRSLDDYRAVLAERPVRIGMVFPRRKYSRLGRPGPKALEYRIGLRTGDTLVLDTRSAAPVTVLGLPAGLGVGLFGTLVALVALFIMNRETRPLAQLAAAVDRIDLAGDPAPLPELRRSAPEIRAVVGAFNRLQGRLSGLLRARLAMLGGISHDVRTFATRLRLRVEMIPPGPDRERAVTDIADMIRLLDDALLASRAGAGELAQELIELAALVRAEVADRQGAGADVSLTIGPAVGQAPVLGDRLALRRIVGNLLENALTYGHRARLTLTESGGDHLLTIDDDGPGIPADQRDLLLEPFVRLESSRNRRTGGAGLGLAVVRSLAEAQGGSIAIGEAPSGGARLEVRLPVFRG